MRGDQIVVHVGRVAGGVADPREAIDLRKVADQPRKANGVALVVLAAPRADILAEQRDLLRARVDQLARFGDQIAIGARDLRAARIGHDAIGAELVAAFLHGEKARRIGPLAFGQCRELGDRGHVGVGRALALHRPVEHLGQAVIGLRADHHADRRRTRHDLFALGLRDAACDRDHRRLVLRLALGQAADVRIDLFRRLLADVAGVEHDEVGIFALGRRHDAAFAEHLGHALAVIDVHLAAEALDPVGLGGIGRFHEVRAFSPKRARVQSDSLSASSPRRDWCTQGSLSR